jgi:hypothetical protein
VGERRQEVQFIGQEEIRTDLEQGEESDFSFYGGPDLSLRRHGQTLSFELGYELRYEQFVEFSDLSDFEHFLQSNATWNATTRDTGTASYSFSQSSSVNQQFQVGELLTLRREVQRHGANASWVHRLSPLAQVEASFQGSLYDYQEDLTRNTRSARFALQATRALSPRLTAGLGSALNQQDFLSTDVVPETSTRFYEGFGIVSYKLGSRTTFSVSAGPAWTEPGDIDDDVDGVLFDAISVGASPAVPEPGIYLVTDTGCPTQNRCLAGFVDLATMTQTPQPRPIEPTSLVGRLPVAGGGDLGREGSLTYFGRAVLRHQWDEVAGQISYTRSASSSSGLGASTILDAVEASLTWTPRPDWTVVATASWDHQELSSETPVTATVTGDAFVDADGRIVDEAQAVYLVPNALSNQVELADNPFESDGYRVELRGSHRLTERFELTGRALWWREDSSTEFDASFLQRRFTSEADGFRIEFGFSFELAPIEL